MCVEQDLTIWPYAQSKLSSEYCTISAHLVLKYSFLDGYLSFLHVNREGSRKKIMPLRPYLPLPLELNCRRNFLFSFLSLKKSFFLNGRPAVLIVRPLKKYFCGFPEHPSSIIRPIPAFPYIFPMYRDFQI